MGVYNGRFDGIELFSLHVTQVRFVLVKQTTGFIQLGFVRALHKRQDGVDDAIFIIVEPLILITGQLDNEPLIRMAFKLGQVANNVCECAGMDNASDCMCSFSSSFFWLANAALVSFARAFRFGCMGNLVEIVIEELFKLFNLPGGEFHLRVEDQITLHVGVGEGARKVSIVQ